MGAAPRRAATAAGLVLGLYYGGTGLGIVASALLVPWLLEAAPPLQAGWPSAWMGLGLLAAMCALVMVPYTPTQGPPSPNAAGTQGTARFVPRQFAFALAAYLMFGLGYIGYMTFIISLLREQHMAVASLSAFYVLLGLGVLASSWLWAGLLQRQRDGRPLAVLNGLLALATLLPVLTAQAWAAFVSGALFGSVFLSVVAATTAIVRHNLPSAAWAAGISGFTVIFALGQIVGPGLVGALSDGAGGLRAGFIASAVLLAAGALLACGQRALPLPQGTAR